LDITSGAREYGSCGELIKKSTIPRGLAVSMGYGNLLNHSMKEARHLYEFMTTATGCV
jgi:hypothetical protein